MNKTEREFVKTVRKHYHRAGRRTLPWRKTKNPYRIIVSEMMLQQTQVERVIPKYKDFLKQFPSWKLLAEASLGDVLRSWQGLGYNRRAKMLHKCARVIVSEYKGKVPHSSVELQKLPGIGPYTAGAVMAFAFDEAIPIIETNIRSAYLHHFFQNKTDVRDVDLLRLIEITLDYENPGEWYAALMDYGAFIKREFGNPNSKSASYKKQSTFNGSDRQIRGAILRKLTRNPHSRVKLHKIFTFDPARIDAQLERLLMEGMTQKKGAMYMLP